MHYLAIKQLLSTGEKMFSFFKKKIHKEQNVPTPYDEILTWDSASIGRAVKDIAKQFGDSCDSSQKAWATAAALIFAEISNSTNAQTGSVDLKGVFSAHGDPIGDYTITVEKITDDPFPEPPRKLLDQNKKRPDAGNLTNKQIRELAFLFAASVIEHETMRLAKDFPTRDEENVKIFLATLPILLDDVVKDLLKKGDFERTAVCFDDAVNMLIAK